MIIFICLAVLAGFAGHNGAKFKDACEQNNNEGKACKVFKNKEVKK